MALKPLAVLAFDRVTEGRRYSPDFFITRLPVEIVTEIVQFIPQPDLANFALVNWDCRQLARSRQFSSVTFNYSDRAIGIVRILHKECLDRSAQDGQLSRPGIGPCIRRIIVRTVKGAIIKIANPEKRAEHATHTACMKQILSVPSVLPHLERINWFDRLTMDTVLFNGI